MSQCSFASAEYALKKKRTRREQSLADMGRVVPLSAADRPDRAAMRTIAVWASAERRRGRCGVWRCSRAKVEHRYHVVKYLFRHRKVRYKGMAKNEIQSGGRQKTAIGTLSPRCVLMAVSDQNECCAVPFTMQRRFTLHPRGNALLLPDKFSNAPNAGLTRRQVAKAVPYAGSTMGHHVGLILHAAISSRHCALSSQK